MLSELVIHNILGSFSSIIHILLMDPGTYLTILHFICSKSLSNLIFSLYLLDCYTTRQFFQAKISLYHLCLITHINTDNGSSLNI